MASTVYETEIYRGDTPSRIFSPSLPPLRAHHFRSERDVWERGRLDTLWEDNETMSPSPKTITAAAMKTNRNTSLRELLHPMAGKCYSINIKKFWI